MFRKLKAKVKRKGKKNASPTQKATKQAAHGIPNTQSEPESLRGKTRGLKPPSTYPKRLLRERSDSAINYRRHESTPTSKREDKGKEKEPEKPSIPTSTSGMQRKKAALKVTRSHSEYNMGKIEDIGEFQTKLDHFAINVQKFIDAGYEPLIARDYPDILRGTPLITAVEEYKNPQELSSGRKLSVCLFEKDGVLYTARYVDMINLYNKPPVLTPAKDGPYIFAIAAKKLNGTDPTNPEMVLELRVIGLTTSGHGTLVKNVAERLGIVCAGEFYVNNGKIILIDDKTGNFNDRMSQIKKDRTDNFSYRLENFPEDEKFAEYFDEDGKFDFGHLISYVMGSAKKDLFYTYAKEDLNLPQDTAIAEERLMQRLFDLHYQEPKNKISEIPSIATSRLSTFNPQSVVGTTDEPVVTEKPNHKA